MKQSFKIGIYLGLIMLALGGIAMLNPLLPILSINVPNNIASFLFILRFLVFFGPFALLVGVFIALLAFKNSLTRMQSAIASVICGIFFIIACLIFTSVLVYSARKLSNLQSTWTTMLLELIQELSLSYRGENLTIYSDISFIVFFLIFGFALGCVNLWLVITSLITTRFILNRSRMAAK